MGWLEKTFARDYFIPSMKIHGILLTIPLTHKRSQGQTMTVSCFHAHVQFLSSITNQSALKLGKALAVIVEPSLSLSIKGTFCA